MEVTEYIQFHPHSDCAPMFSYDPEDCNTNQFLCIHKNGEHYHVEVQPFTVRGNGFVHGDYDAGELIPMLYENFLAEITSLINDSDDFVLAFKITGTPDYESGHIDDWDYELLGRLEQDGNNLVVKPLEVSLKPKLAPCRRCKVDTQLSVFEPSHVSPDWRVTCIICQVTKHFPQATNYESLVTAWNEWSEKA